MLVAGGHRLEYVLHEPQHGPAAGQPMLVFLHEGLGSVALWKDFPSEVVALTGCAALVYSRYGYGKSDPLTGSRNVDYMHREALEVLPQVLDHFRINSPVLVGHSDGASIALIHAGAGKRPVSGVVAVAPHVFVEDITVKSIAEAKTAFQHTDLPQKLSRYHDNVVSAFVGWNDIWLHPDFRRWNIEDYLPGIVVPVLLIQGENDQYGTEAQVSAVARQVSGPVESIMLPGCGHSPHQTEHRPATIAAIARFVAKLRKSA